MFNYIKNLFSGKDKPNNIETKNIDIQNIQNINNNSSGLKIDTPQSLSYSYLSKKHERSIQNNSQISENFKIKKISETEKEFIDINKMSHSQVVQEKSELIKEIELNQKRLKDLEKYENKLNKETKNTLSKSQNKYEEKEKNKEPILQSVREISLHFYMKNEKNQNRLIKSLDQKRFDNMPDQIKVEQFKEETVLKTQTVDNKYDNKGFNNIKLHENENLNSPTKNNNSKSKNIKNNQINQKKENNENIIDIKTNKSVTFDGNINNRKINEIFGNEYLNSNKSIIIIPSKNNKINNYSYKCITNNLNFSIQKGIEVGNFVIEIENNGLLTWPKNKTILEVDNSKPNSINAQNIPLEPLDPGIKAPVNIIVNQINKYMPGKYCIFLDFKVDGKKYGESILINIEITENTNKINYKPIIPAFRKEYGFNKFDCSDKTIIDALVKYHNFENAEKTIFENKFKNNSYNLLL